MNPVYTCATRVLNHSPITLSLQPTIQATTTFPAPTHSGLVVIGYGYPESNGRSSAGYSNSSAAGPVEHASGECGNALPPSQVGKSPEVSARIAKWITVTIPEAERFVAFMEGLRRVPTCEPIDYNIIAHETGFTISDIHVALNILAQEGVVNCSSEPFHAVCSTPIGGLYESPEAAFSEIFKSGPICCPNCSEVISAKDQIGIHRVFTHMTPRKEVG